ncbi:ParB N-terminal domain-containing protein [Sneathiella aquimaris]|uniref:ParB N-terminal domain-containing protein n=1 Tax=Sneathiella aquimaris TaxID=2599305 RepID=UPI00146D3D55|nr:ParB N-terminal domain-containing protein [Sneathiella aquimaris]
MKFHTLPIEKIYVPTARKKLLDESKVEVLAEDILENGQKTPIQVRQGKDRYVLVEGYHRLQACHLLGEETINAYLVQAKKF